MASTSKDPVRVPLHRLVLKLVVVAAAVAVTAAIAVTDRPVVERRHAPLAETAVSASQDADVVTSTTVAASEHGTRP